MTNSARRSVSWLQIFRDYYVPMNKAFDALDAAARPLLERDVLDLLEKFNRAGEAALVVPADYLEVVIIKRLPQVLQ